MKWLRISNPGVFDVDSALNMLGASVKTGTNPIGMFGSGTKYALAQACREGISVKISTGSKLYSVATDTKKFRDVDFQKVVLRSTTGGSIKTPMTTEFGAKDWKDVWFIFRELYSNAIDEGNHQIDVVDGVDVLDGQTCVFLPYNNFKHVYHNLEKYFTKHEEGLWIGDGCVYRNNVFVGQWEGCKINLNNSDIVINECRVMDLDYARSELEAFMRYCLEVDVWVEFLKSSDEFLERMNVKVYKHQTETAKVIHEALIVVYGENYCLCPNVNDIVRDVQSMGYVAVVLKGLNINSEHVKTFVSLDSSQSCRLMNEDEATVFNTIRKSISAFIPDDCQPAVKIISDGAAQILGQADIVSEIIYIRVTLFQPALRKELVNTIIHEFGHIITKKGDYDRPFTNFFINALTELTM